MKGILPLLLSLYTFTCAGQVNFQTAYENNNLVPSGLLEAVAWTNTRMVHLSNQQSSCVGYPQAYGIMGLHDNGLGYFNENGILVSNLSGISVNDQKGSANVQVMAYASAYQTIMQNSLSNDPNNPNTIRSCLYQLSEIPDSGMVNLLARDMQVYEILKFMNSTEKAQLYGFQPHHFNLTSVFGNDNHAVLSGEKIEITTTGIENQDGIAYMNNANASLEYAPALWNPAATCNFSPRNGVPISAITIHTIQGTYAGAISWAQNCAAGVSYHYVIRSTDGQVTQMLDEIEKGWHVGTENPYTIGYEHEGYVSDPAWYTEEMYHSSAHLSRDIVNSGYGIPPLRTYYGASSITTQLLGNCTKIKGHQHYANQTHTDPGINWDWEKYYRLINLNPTIGNTYISSTGTLYDSGGPTGDYTDDERELYLIQPPNTASIELNFSTFNLESGYDNLFVYDGDTIGAPLLGAFTGTTLPGTLISSGGSMLLEFRSDCSTTQGGWEANWTSTQYDLTPPVTQVWMDTIWHTEDFIVNFDDTDAESGVKERYYLPTAGYFTTPEHSEPNLGFFWEEFETPPSSWLIPSGVFNHTGSDYEVGPISNQNTNTFYYVEQDNSSSFLFEWNQTITSNDVNQRAGMHFFCDDASLPNRGNSYFVYLRSNDDKVQIYSVDNDVFNLEVDTDYPIDTITTYNCRTTYNPSTGWIRVFINGQFVSEWQDPTPLTQGNSISLRTGGCEATFDDIKVYRSRGSQVMIPADGPANSAWDIMTIESVNAVPTGFVHSIVLDSADLWSTVDVEDYLLDFSSPDVSYIADGPIGTFEVDSLWFGELVQGNWSIFDVHSGMNEYEVAIGTLPQLDDIVPWSNVGSVDTVMFMPFSMSVNTLYYLGLRATNNAGLTNTFLSDGFVYVGNLSIDESKLEDLTIYPNPATTSLFFKNLTANVEVLIYDVTGKVCLNEQLYANKVLDVSNLSSGVYRAIVRSGSEIVVKEIVIQ